MKSRNIFLSIFLVPSFFFGQQPIGTWKAHVPQSSFTWIGETSDFIYGANNAGMIITDKRDQSNFSLSKVNGLTQTGISYFSCDSATNHCVVGYENGNLDIILSDNSIVNQPAIVNSTIIGNKSVNHIFFYDGTASISTGIGLIRLDLKTFNIIDNIELNHLNVKYPAICSFIYRDSLLFVASNNYIFQYSLEFLATLPSPSLIPYNQKTGKIEQIFTFRSRVFARYVTPFYGRDTLLEVYDSEAKPTTFFQDEGLLHVDVHSDHLIVTHQDHISKYDSNFITSGNIFTYGKDYFECRQAIQNLKGDKILVADARMGIAVTSFENQFNSEVFALNSPQPGILSRLASVNEAIVMLPGGSEFTYLTPIISRYQNQEWVNSQLSNDSFPDFRNGNDAIELNDKYFISSNRGGLAMVNANLELELVYNENNSPIEDLVENSQYNYYGITSLDKDSEGNIYVAQNKSPAPIKILLATNDWITISFKDNGLTSPPTRDLIILENSTLVLNVSPFGVLFYDFSGTISNLADDRYRLLTSSPEDGNLPSLEILNLAEDKSGALWIGSDAGISVIYSPENVFNSGFEGAQRIIVKQDNYNGYLFETETIEKILVDGANRKWVGTSGSGLYLVSADGTEQLEHFTAENSPLFDNKIEDLAILPKTGEVFILSEGGLLSYRGSASDPQETMTSLHVFPNPVKASYTGPIAINNLTENAIVRITDASGRLVYETTSAGGQAIWSGVDAAGNRVQSGVYLIFASTENGAQGVSAKVLILN